MGNPNSLGSNNHDIGTATEWDSLEKVSRDDLPKMEEAVGSYWPSEEEMRKNETNLNSKTGKERTYSDFDLYSINNYKSAAEQGERRKERNDLITWYELISYDEYRKKYGRDKTSAETNKEYTDLLKSLVEKFPREEEESLADYRQRAKGIVDSVEGTTSSEPLDKQAEYDRIKEKLITAAEEKRMSKSHVERLIANQLDRYVEKRVQESGTKKDTKALIDELLHLEGFEAEIEEAKQHLEDETEHQEAKETEVELSPEVQKWLEEELKDVDDWARSHRDFTEEKAKKAKEEVMAKARDKQAALDREQAAAETAEAGEEHQADAEKDKDETDAAAAEAEAAAAAEREKAAAAEREQAAAEERAEAEKKEKLIEAIAELGERYDQLEKEFTKKQLAETRKLLEQVNDNIEQIKKRKRPGLAAFVASFFAKRGRGEKAESKWAEKKTGEAKMPERIEAGKALIYTEKQDEWQKCVDIRTHDIYDGRELDVAIKGMRLLDEGADFGVVKESLDEENMSGAADSIVRSIIFSFSKRGPEYYQSLIESEGRELTEEEKRMIAEQKLKNTQMKLHDLELKIAPEAKKTAPAEPEKATDKHESAATFGDFEKRDYHFWSSVGEDGIKYMTKKDPFNDEELRAVEDWWNSLDDETKEGFHDVRYQIGRPLRVLLIDKGVLPPDTGDYLKNTPENDKRVEESAQYLNEEYHYWNSVGEEGIRYLIGEEKPNDENAERIMSWWNSLDSRTQEHIFEQDTLPSYRNLVAWIRNRLEAERKVA